MYAKNNQQKHLQQKPQFLNINTKKEVAYQIRFIIKKVIFIIK